MGDGCSEWQLSSGLLSRMEDGSSEWQLASGLLSRVDDGSNEWQLALGLLMAVETMVYVPGLRAEKHDAVGTDDGFSFAYTPLSW